MSERSPAEEGGEKQRKRIDLSVAQVAASALATVAGALLASELGVYGTILGAAVVSIGATTGGAVFQHIFRRTGEQLREAVVDRGPGQTVNGLRQVPERPVEPAPTVISSEWNEPQVVRARRRWTWKTYAAVSGLVFLLAMTPIVAFELATGQPVSATVKGESGNGTSFGGVVGPKPSSPREAPPAERPSTGGGHGSDPTPSGGASAPVTTRPSREPSASPSGGSGERGDGTASPSASPSATPSAGSSPSADGGKPSGGASPKPSEPSDAPTSVAPPPAAPTGAATP
ncbi:hypothetical protein P3T27_006687 [Kitasatospora sp. MAA19]|uniref:hypothetical protein n=1 Tax=Kitasatospora sp. MAA19 TaxID=3035090 RepID=UPI002473C117|nr:hypothetical protein [Kitasatospora sp. MAA19]MDH6709938.1 hypothetical protein [Kitasatospora sp. MAA19]